MQLRITRGHIKYLGEGSLVPFGVERSHWVYSQDALIDISRMSRDNLMKFRDIVEANKHVRGLTTMLADIDAYLDASSGAVNEKPLKTVQAFYIAAVQYLAVKTEHQFLFKRLSLRGEITHAYYVDQVTYTPKKRVKDYDGNVYVRPAYVTVSLAYSEMGDNESESIQFYIADVYGKTVKEIFFNRGFLVENEKLYADYEKDYKRYLNLVQSVGKQHLAYGEATDDCDGNRNANRSSWSWRTHNSFQMEKDEGPAKVVVDIFYEGEKESKHRKGDVTNEFWLKEKQKMQIAAGKLDPDSAEDDVEEREEDYEKQSLKQALDAPKVVERTLVPPHFYLVVFDLKRHLRLKIHASQLEEYVYDEKMADRLVLPEEQKVLVKMLVDHKDAGFEDIIKGKAGGAIVLLCGAPGTGKTLTAEVFAESEKKALYSVQASQLGLDASSLEERLMTALQRAKRWNAVMLLDESDVYVHQRGNSIEQNAIVGVFLRVLEYYPGVLFLTTNRPDDVDDAVASRCIAKIVYKYPTAELQWRIWRVLADVAKIPIDDNEITMITKRHAGELSGRDVKNLLKLANLFSRSQKKPITADVIDVVKEFKPTATQHEFVNKETNDGRIKVTVPRMGTMTDDTKILRG